MDNFMCKNCGIDTLKKGEYFMINNYLWDSLNTQGMLCIGCIEKKIKRKLDRSDFTLVPLNFNYLMFGTKGKKSTRLLRRQGFINKKLQNIY